MSCKDTQKFRTSEASTKAAMRTQGAIDGFLNILDLGLFRTLNGKWSRDAKERFNVQGMLFSEEDNGRVAKPNKQAFKQIDNAKGIYYQTSAPVKSGVSEVFNSTPELAYVGTPEQYSAYLDTIFPDSKVKDIVYHGGYINKDAEFKIGNGEFGRGIYFTPSKQSAQEYLSVMGDAPNLISTIVDLKNPVLFGDNKPEKGKSPQYIQSKFNENPTNDGSIYTDTKLINNSIGVDEKFNDEVKVNSSKQIHILGSKQDIEGFKKFISSSKQSVADSQTIVNVKKAIDQMGISLMTLAEYAKNSDIATTSINGLADLTKNIIAIAEGKEAEALTEEMVHVATAILEQVDPRLVTEMISKIDRFKIYKQVYEQYKNNPKYQLENGKPNIRKIKKEAVDKLIAEVIINNSSDIEQFPELQAEENVSLMKRFWNAILDLFRRQYKNSDISIFEKAAGKIMEGIGTVDQIQGEGVYLQQSTEPVNNLYDTLRDYNKRIILSPATSTDKRHYTFDGTRILKTVTEKIKGLMKWDTTEYQQKIYDQMKEWGIVGHTYVEQYLNSALIDENGFARATPLEVDIDTELPEKVQIVLQSYLKDLVNSYAPGTRFLTETKMVNTKPKGMLASTIDLVAIEPNETTGVKVDIYDWKFTSINKEKTEDVPWYKQEEWKAQMGEYAQMLYNIGIKPNQIRRARMIPFSVKYDPTIKGDWSSDLKLTALEIGKFDNVKETKLYLLPVPLDLESTGNKFVDELVSSLKQQYKKLYKTKVTLADKPAKNLQLNQLSKAIRKLQLTLNFEPISNVMSTFLKNAAHVYKTFEDVNYDNMSARDIQEKLGELIKFKATASKFIDIDKVFTSMFDDRDMTPEEKKILTNLEKYSASVKRMIAKFNVLQEDYIVHIALKTGLTEEDVRSAEKPITSFIEKNLIEASKLSSSLIKLATNLMLKSRSLATKKASDKIDEYFVKLAALEQEAAKLGKSAFDMIGKVENGSLTFVKKISKKFYEDFDKAINDKNKDFFLDNMDVEAFKKRAKEVIENGERELDNVLFSSDPELNDMERDYNKRKLRSSLDIDSKDFNGYQSYQFQALFKENMKEDNFLSQDYKDMSKNAAALDVWKFFTQLNEHARKMGYLTDKGNSFFPLIEAAFVQKVSQTGDVIGQARDFFKDLYTIDPNEENTYAKFDEETRSVRKEIPKLFTRTNKSVDQLSKDLTKVGVLWIKSLMEYEEANNIENLLITLHSVEKTKGQLAVNPANGKIIRKAGDVVTEKDKSVNADILEVIINDYLYGIREDDTSFFNIGLDTVTSKFISDEAKRNEKTVSIKKGFDNMNILTQGLAVGLKYLIAIPNYFGVNFQAFINSGNMYTFSEYMANQARVVGDTVGAPSLSTIDKGLLDIFIGLNEGIDAEKQRQRAIKEGKYAQWISSWNFNDVMMSTNSFPERKLQIVNALSFLQNTMLVDGKLVNIRQYVSAQDRGRYKLSYAERREIEATKEERIKKLKAEKSLVNVAKEENGNIVVEGLTPEAIADYRVAMIEYSRDLSGQMNNDNKAGYRRDTIFKSAMMFKGWIPKQVSLRTLDINKNLETGEWQYGRARLFTKVMVDQGFRTISTIRNILAGNDEGLAYMNAMLEAKKEAYKEKEGKELIITEEEFYDLVRREVSNQMKELGLLLGLFALLLAAKAAEPDDDDDEYTKNRYKFWAKALNKITDEVRFYYDPSSVESITSGNIIPQVGLLTKVGKAIGAIEEESRGRIFGDQELIDKSHPTKYFLNLLPFGSQFQNEWLPLIDPEFAKEMGIRVSSEARPGR